MCNENVEKEFKIPKCLCTCVIDGLICKTSKTVFSHFFAKFKIYCKKKCLDFLTPRCLYWVNPTFVIFCIRNILENFGILLGIF